MKLTKIDLSCVVAIAHDRDCLGLLIDRGDGMELIEVPAPEAAFYGLQGVSALVNNDMRSLSSSPFDRLFSISETLGINGEIEEEYEEYDDNFYEEALDYNNFEEDDF